MNVSSELLKSGTHFPDQSSRGGSAAPTLTFWREGPYALLSWVIWRWQSLVIAMKQSGWSQPSDTGACAPQQTWGSYAQPSGASSSSASAAAAPSQQQRRQPRNSAKRDYNSAGAEGGVTASPHLMSIDEMSSLSLRLWQPRVTAGSFNFESRSRSGSSWTLS